MEGQHKLKRNLIYQTVYQILITITPLITAPYISRTLGAENLGIFSYTNANASYFAMFAILGMTNYGCRIIAQHRENIEKRNALFSELFSMQLLTGAIATFLYCIYFLESAKDNIFIVILQGLWIVASWLDFSWFFFGIEEFELTAKTNICIKIIIVLLIVTFVRKNEYGLVVYTLIMSGGQVVSSVALIPFLRRYIILKKPKWNSIKRHFKHNFNLFIPILASSVFHIMDKTMLGALSGYSELGYYYNSDKLINIPIGILTGFSNVMMPRISNLNINHQVTEKNKILSFSFELNTLVSVALSFGIAAISNEFIPLFFGEGYTECIELVYLFSPILIIKGLSIFFRMQYLIPMEREKGYIFAMIFGAVSNLCVNLILIPRFGATGAVIGTLIAELVALFVEWYWCKDQVNIRKNIILMMKYIIIGTIMFFLVRIIGRTGVSIIAKICFEIVIGIISFSSLSLMLVIRNNKQLKLIIYNKYKKIIKTKNEDAL